MHKQLAALVVFLLIFLGVGAVASWVDPQLGLTTGSFWALIVWGLLLVGALVAASTVAGGKHAVIPGGRIYRIQHYFVVTLQLMRHAFVFTISLVNQTVQTRALESRL